MPNLYELLEEASLSRQRVEFPDGHWYFKVWSNAEAARLAAQTVAQWLRTQAEDAKYDQGVSLDSFLLHLAEQVEFFIPESEAPKNA